MRYSLIERATIVARFIFANAPQKQRKALINNMKGFGIDIVIHYV